MRRFLTLSLAALSLIACADADNYPIDDSGYEGIELSDEFDAPPGEGDLDPPGSEEEGLIQVPERPVTSYDAYDVAQDDNWTRNVEHDPQVPQEWVGYATAEFEEIDAEEELYDPNAEIGRIEADEDLYAPYEEDEDQAEWDQGWDSESDPTADLDYVDAWPR